RMGGAFMPPSPRQVHPVAEGFAPRDLAHPVSRRASSREINARARIARAELRRPQSPAYVLPLNSRVLRTANRSQPWQVNKGGGNAVITSVALGWSAVGSRVTHFNGLRPGSRSGSSDCSQSLDPRRALPGPLRGGARRNR